MKKNKRIIPDKAVIAQLEDFLNEGYAEKHFKIVRHQLSAAQRGQMIDGLIRFQKFLPTNLSPVQIACLMYHVVTQTITYDKEKKSNNRYSYLQALREKKAVCMGIAELYNILCVLCNIQCKIVVGYCGEAVEEGSSPYHAWNQLYLPDSKGDMHWYMADPTWDLKETQSDWRYFLKSDDYFLDHDHYWLRSAYKKCSKTMENIPAFHREGVDYLCRVFTEVTQCL